VVLKQFGEQVGRYAALASVKKGVKQKEGIKWSARRIKSAEIGWW